MKRLYHTTLTRLGKWLPMDFCIILIVAEFREIWFGPNSTSYESSFNAHFVFSWVIY